MNIFSDKFINTINIILTIIIVLIINITFYTIKNLQYINVAKENVIEENVIEKNYEKKEDIETKDNYNWYLEIPSIKLKAPIEETTQITILNKAIGHFEDTSITNGNIGLAAHNRGYEKNYFEKLKDVKMKDEITYFYNNFSKKYIVDTIEIIKNTDWTYLENTDENKITLITCTENEPNYRLCVQASEK